MVRSLPTPRQASRVSMVADAKRVGHRGERRIHRPDARQDARHRVVRIHGQSSASLSGTIMRAAASISAR